MLKHPNPNAPDYALTLADITHDRKVLVRIAKDPTASREVRIQGAPVRRPWPQGECSVPAIQVLKADGVRTHFYLADMGIVPYPNGRWSRNYTIAAQ